MPQACPDGHLVSKSIRSDKRISENYQKITLIDLQLKSEQKINFVLSSLFYNLQLLLRNPILAVM